MPRAVVVREGDLTELNPLPERGQLGRARPIGHLGVRVQHLEDALRRADRLLQVGVDPAEFARRTVHHERVREKGRELADGELAGADLGAGVPEGGHDAQAAQQLHQRRQRGQRGGDLQVDPIEPLRRSCEPGLLLRFRAEGLDDPVTGERFRAQVRDVLERLLAPARRPADALPEPHQRVEHQGGAGEADDRQARVDPEQRPRVAHQGQRLAKQIADGLRHPVLDLVDVVGDVRHQLAGGAPLEEPCRLVEDVPEELIAQIAHHPLADVGHQVGREERPHAFDDVEREDDRRHPGQPLLGRKDHVDDGLDLINQDDVGAGVEDHRAERCDEAPAIRPRVPEQTIETVHSVNRYFKSTQSATTPSRQVIFLPSSYPRPS